MASTAAPRKPSRPMVTLICMKSLRRASLGLMASNRRTPAQRQTTWESARWMLAAGAEVAGQTKDNQKNRKDQCHFCQARPLSSCMSRISAKWMHHACRVDAKNTLDVFTAECAPSRPWQRPAPGPASPWSYRRGRWSAARHAPSPASPLLRAPRRSAGRR